MFLSTLRQRIANHCYHSVDEFSSDVWKLLDGVPKTASTSLKDKVAQLLLSLLYESQQICIIAVRLLTDFGCR